MKNNKQKSSKLNKIKYMSDSTQLALEVVKEKPSEIKMFQEIP